MRRPAGRMHGVEALEAEARGLRQFAASASRFNGPDAYVSALAEAQKLVQQTAGALALADRVRLTEIFTRRDSGRSIAAVSNTALHKQDRQAFW